MVTPSGHSLGSGVNGQRGAHPEVIALVDLFNVGPKARTDRDYEDLMELIGGLIRRQVPRMAGSVTDVEARLYGGFYSKVGTATEQYVRASRSLNKLTGLRSGVRIRGKLATALACLPGLQLIGTYKNGGQKMVDQMVANDALHFARSSEFDQIVLVADDDDYVPAVLVLSTETTANFQWLRRRSNGLNDKHFAHTGTKFSTDGAWQ